MRIAWCSPFHRRSAIGRVSQLIVDELRGAAEVDIWHPPTAEPLDTSATRVTLGGGPADAARLAAYDFAVFNMGNHADNHSEIFEASRQTPGVVVLHDLVLQGFFSAHYFRHIERRDRYTSAMRRWYGAAGVVAAGHLTAGAGPTYPESTEAFDFPLFEEAIAGAYAVVTHSEESAKRVREVFPGLVRHFPLPYDLKRGGRVPPRESLAIPVGRILAVTIGNVTPNKRVAAVFELLGNQPEIAARIFYVVAGEVAPDHKPGLMRLIEQYGLKDTVRLTGYAPEDTLRAYLTHADFCINLRHPTAETGSASAIEQLLYGKPLIVSDTGFYRELPDDCVFKARVDREAEDLLSAIGRLAGDPLLRGRMGERARSYARQTFRVDRYARGIVELSDELLDAKPLLDFTDRIGRELCRMGVSSDLPLVSTVADLSGELFRE